jgi:fatty acid synthase subunit beta
MVDLTKTAVVVGMGEVSPWGNRRTRWEIESQGEFSIEGCIELAWIMSLIKYHNGPLKDGQKYVGWVDAKTMTPVKDSEVKKLYEETIMQHCGIREVEPELWGGYNPHKKMFLHEVALNHDMEPVEVFSQEEANQYKLEHNDKVDIFEKEGRWYVQMKKGANVHIPRAMKFDRFVAGQVPTGWNAAQFGVPKDIIDQVDKVTLYNLVSTCEALVSAGVTDPYEFYEYVHVSEVGNTSGSGIGGFTALRKTYRERFQEKPVQADILQEVFINVMPAWVNMLLLSSSGPIKTPVGACATSAESVELGVDCIVSGKAKVVVVGGYDDIGEESSYEFGQMQATSNSVEEVKMGRTPKEMSRPCADTRAGFMESQGAGTQILMSADLAIMMGVPIFGIVALTNTATDKVGRSIPAPGRGLLTTAKESKNTGIPTNLLLDIKYRKRQLEFERETIKRWKEHEIELLNMSAESPEIAKQNILFVEQQAERREKVALAMWGNEFYVGNHGISPIRGALAVWGLTLDDLGVASFHGTGTKANDFNESQVTQLQLEHLGRKKGKLRH